MSVNRPSNHLVAFEGSLFYKASAASLGRAISTGVDLRSPGKSVLEVTTNGRVFLGREFNTKDLGDEFSRLEFTIERIVEPTVCELVLDGKRFDNFLIQPIYTQNFWELEPETRTLRLEATPLSQLTGPYLWLRYRIASKDFYTSLHTEITARILRFYDEWAPSATKDQALGRERFNAARRILDFQNNSTYEAEELWSSLLFGVARSQFPNATQFFEAISEANQPRRHWDPIFSSDNPKQWFIKTLTTALTSTSASRDPDEIWYKAWVLLLRMNLIFAGKLNHAEYELISESRSASITLSQEKPIQGVFLCFQSGAYAQIPGLQYFEPNMPVSEMLVLRRIDNVLQVPKKVFETKFNYSEPFFLPDIKHYAVDVSPLDGKTTTLLPRLVKAGISLSGEGYRKHNTPVAAVMPNADRLPRMSSFSGDYYRLMVTLPGTYTLFGDMYYPTRIHITERDEVLPEQSQTLFDLIAVALRSRSAAFSYHVDNSVQRTMDRVAAYQLSARPQFPRGLPAGSTLDWSVSRADSGLQVIPEAHDQLTLELAGEEESAGVYRLVVSAPATASSPALKSETLVYYFDFQLGCMRCGSGFSVLSNEHGACRFHAHKPESTHPDQDVESVFNPYTDVETVDGIILGTIQLNPNVFWGVGRSTSGSQQHWLCCNQLVRQPGCYVGRHSSVSSRPDLCDWLHNGPRRGTEWRPDERTSERQFSEIVKAYSEKRFADGLRLEWQFNEVHGGQLALSFQFKDPAVGQAALEQLLREGFGAASEPTVLALLNAVDFKPSFGMWQVDRTAQLAYQYKAPTRSSVPPVTLADRSLTLLRVFRVLRNLPIQNPQRLNDARLAVVQRWLALEQVPSQAEADQFAGQESALFAQLVRRIDMVLAAAALELNAFKTSERQLSTQLERLRTLIYQQKNPEEYLLRFQYTTLAQEAQLLKLPFSVRFWNTQRTRLQYFLRNAFFTSANEKAFRTVYEPTLLNLEAGREVSFGAPQPFAFSTAEQIEARRQRVVALELEVNANLANLETFLRENANRRQQSLDLARDFENLIEPTVVNVKTQLAATRTRMKNAQERVLRGYPAEQDLLETYRAVWQYTDPVKFNPLYRKVDIQRTVLKTSDDRTVRRAILLEVVDRNLADYAQLSTRILNNTLYELTPEQLQDLYDKLRRVSFGTKVADSLAYTETLLRDSVFNGPSLEASRFFRAMDRLTNPDGFHSLPKIERPASLLQERWDQLKNAYRLDLLNTDRVLNALPSNPDYISRIDGQTTRKQLLEFYADIQNNEANLGAKNARLLQIINIGPGQVPYLAAVTRWESDQQVDSRTQWLEEMRAAVDGLREPPATFLATVIKTALEPQNELTLSGLIGRPAVPALLEYIRANPGEIPALWAYLNPGTAPTDQDVLVRRLINPQQQDRRLIEIETALSQLPDIPWPVNADFMAYRRLLQQIQVPSPTGIPRAGYWFVNWYTRETKAAFPTPNVRGYLSEANALLDLLTLPNLSAHSVRTAWKSTKFAQLARLFASGEEAQSWLTKFRAVYALLAASVPNPNFQTAMLTTVASLNDSTVVSGSKLRRRWQYLHWGEEYKLRPEEAPFPRDLSLLTLNLAYFENDLPPLDSTSSRVSYLLRAELAQAEQNQLRVGGLASATLSSARSQAASANWLHHQLLRGDNDPVAYLVMAVLLAGTSRLEYPNWSMVGGDGSAGLTITLIRTIDQELKRVDLSAVQPALDEMRRNPRPQSVGINYKRVDGRLVELAGSPFLLRPIWPAANPLARAWFTVLSYAFEQSQVLMQMRTEDHLYVLEFLTHVCHMYITGTPVGQMQNQLYDYLEGVVDSLDPKQPDALAYFVHAFALHPTPNFQGRRGDLLASRLVDLLPLNASGELTPGATPDAWALQLNSHMGVQHLVLRPYTDPFDLTEAIGPRQLNNFQLWLTLSGAVNPDAERTRIPVFLDNEKQAFILYKTRYEQSRLFYNDPDELALLEREKRHSLYGVLSGAVARDLNGFVEFDRMLKAGATFVLELTPSLEVYWAQHQRNLQSLREHITEVQEERYQAEAANVELNVETTLQRVYTQDSAVVDFFTQIEAQRLATLARIDASPAARLVPATATYLKDMLSVAFFEKTFAALLPDNEQYANELRALHAANRNYTVYVAAMMQILIQRLELSAGNLAPIQKELGAIWDILINIIDNALVHIATQTAGLVANIDPTLYQAKLQALDGRLRLELSSNLASFDYAEFTTQLTDIQTNQFITVPFINKAKLDDVQRRLSGGDLAAPLQRWGAQLVRDLEAVVNDLQQILIRTGRGVLLPAGSAPSLALTSFSRPFLILTGRQIETDLTNLYIALFFRAWYAEQQLDNPVLVDGFNREIVPLLEQTAREILVWCERTGFWQDGDALLALAVLSRDLVRLTTTSEVFARLGLNNIPDVVVNLSRVKDPQILSFTDEFITQGGLLNALSAQVSDVFKPGFQVLIERFNQNVQWFNSAEQQLRTYIHSASLQPQYSLTYLPEVQTAMNALPAGSIFSDVNSALHQLFDNWIRPTLNRYTSGMQVLLRLFANPVLTHSASRTPARPSMVSRALDLSRTAFLPLLTSARFEPGGLIRMSRVQAICQAVAEWEDDNATQILSSRWPSVAFDTLRSRTDLRRIGGPSRPDLARDVDTILNAQQWNNLPPTGAYLRMFRGDPEVARRLESLFHFGVDNLSAQEMDTRYDQLFQNSPSRWLRYNGKRLPDTLPAELLRIIAQSNQDVVDVLPGTDDLVKIAMRPYIGRLNGRGVRERYLRDMVGLGLSRNQLNPAVNMLSVVRSRKADGAAVDPDVLRRWREKTNEDNTFAEFIATSETPSSPWGLDLYLAVGAGNTVTDWALWENRLPSTERPLNQSLVQLAPAGGEAYTALILRGIVDAAEIDNKLSAFVELYHQIGTVGDRTDPSSGGVLPNIYNPVSAQQLRLLSNLGFRPTFPYRGLVSGNKAVSEALLENYTPQSRLRLQILEPAVQSALYSQLTFYGEIFKQMEDDNDINFAYPNVALELDPPRAPIRPVLPWQNFVPSQITNRPGMLLQDMSTIQITP